MSQRDDPRAITTPGGRLADDRQSVLRRMAVGSAWMVAARWSVRGIGLVSTLILARLLAPTDFGLVAMAMIAIEFIGIFAEAGQYAAVIRTRDATPEHFDTAWTMAVCSGLIVAIVLQAIAPLAGWYFDEPRVVPVIRVLGLAPLFESFTNVGVVVGFRRDLRFGKDFQYVVLRKLSGFMLGVPLALLWGSYWALVVGIVCGRLLTAALSYRMHPYRPRLRLPRLREIWSFSVWMQLAGIAGFFRNQTDRMVVASVAGAAVLGDYHVAADIATAPTAELVAPAARVIFPVYATLLHDRERLARSYLDVLAVFGVIGLSTGVGVSLVAHDMVSIVLGKKWLVAAQLVPWLAIGGCLYALEQSVNDILGVTGYARLDALRNWAFVALLAPAAVLGGHFWGVEGVAAARLTVAAIFVPVMFYTLIQVIPVSAGQILSRLWRPALAALAMAAALALSGMQAIHPVGLRLFSEIVLGAMAFLAALLALWLLAGRPAGAEAILVGHIRGLVQRIQAGVVRRLAPWRRKAGGQTPA